jgi:hypothetical protein
MPSRFAAFGLMISLGLLPSACGCATRSEEGRFLSSYSTLPEAPRSEGVYLDFSSELANYHHFTLAPLVIRFSPERTTPVMLRDVDLAKAAFRDAVIDALTRDGRFQLTSSPGKGVLSIRAAVTDLYQQDPELPAGPATLEIEAIDPTRNKRIFALIDSTLGEKDSGGEHTDARSAFARFGRRLRSQIDRAEDRSLHDRTN